MQILLILLQNLGFDMEVLRSKLVSIGSTSVFKHNFQLRDKTWIKIEAFEGELDNRFVVFHETPIKEQSRVLVKGKLTEGELERLPYELASMLIRFK
jgi:hypothetical protein